MKTEKVVVIDYGIGNLYSVQRALEYCGTAEVIVTASPDSILAADRLVLPGVGAFSDGMRGLRERGLIEPILEYAEAGKPLLGICLGMQMLTSTSEEFGMHKGLDLIPGRVRQIPNRAIDGSPLRSPNIGWCGLEKPESKIWRQTLLDYTTPGGEVYMVHSYAVELEDSSNLLAFCNFGGHQISAVIGRNNVYGCQFHPEKSGEEGLKIIQAFLNCRPVNSDENK